MLVVLKEQQRGQCDCNRGSRRTEGGVEGRGARGREDSSHSPSLVSSSELDGKN